MRSELTTFVPAKSRCRRAPSATSMSSCPGGAVRGASLRAWGRVGGGVGAMLGMLVFRHKTAARRHPAFCWGLPLVFLLQLAVCTWLLWRS